MDPWMPPDSTRRFAASAVSTWKCQGFVSINNRRSGCGVSTARGARRCFARWWNAVSCAICDGGYGRSSDGAVRLRVRERFGRAHQRRLTAGRPLDQSRRSQLRVDGAANSRNDLRQGLDIENFDV